MKIKIAESAVDEVLLKRLKMVLAYLEEGTDEEIGLDRPHLIYGHKMLINYYGNMDEVPW
jgi:hypothetical protein